MKRAAWILASAVLSIGGGCSDVEKPRPQWLVVISTDAPVPQFGDRLLVQVLDADGKACETCRRERDVGNPEAWPISFGVEASPSVARIRARLYRAVLRGPSAPRSDRILDAIAKLPRADGITEVDIGLPMACFGVVADPDTDRSCDEVSGILSTVVTRGKGKPLATGSWAPAAHVDCEGPAPEGMVCIPGGAFLLGDPIYVPQEELDPIPEQLVVVAPFFLDREEFKVRDYRKHGSGASPAVPKGSGISDMCTYTTQPGPNEEMPINCVRSAGAAMACRQLGKRLPTEAEWEWAAGNLERETPYPWITSDSPCDNAVVSKGRITGGPLGNNEDSGCLGADELPGPRAGGNPKDETELGVRNLAGNVTEWMSDAFLPYTDPRCWGSAQKLHTSSPCSADVEARSYRGGNWRDLSAAARVTTRGNQTESPNVAVGFRCAK